MKLCFQLQAAALHLGGMDLPCLLSLDLARRGSRRAYLSTLYWSPCVHCFNSSTLEGGWDNLTGVGYDRYTTALNGGLRRAEKAVELCKALWRGVRR